MDADNPQTVRIWRFHTAPPDIQELFPDGREDDWVVQVAEADLPLIGPSLLSWRRIYPVQTLTMPDGSTVLWGAPRKAVTLIDTPAAHRQDAPPSGVERRNTARVRVQCDLRYEAHSDRMWIGEGHTIDMSATGIYFTTESSLPMNAKVTIYIKWPVRLEQEIPVELRATGRLVRVEDAKAAMQVEETAFVSAG
jgi:hypothetical protein